MLEVHKELTVRGSEAALTDFIERLTECLDDGWQRNLEGEQKAKRALDSLAGEKEIWYGFMWNGDRDSPAALVWLSRTSGIIRVINMLPIEYQRLTTREYNTILENFTERFVARAAQRAGVRFELSSGLVDIRTLMDAATYDALCRFSRAANKDAGTRAVAPRRA